MEAPATAVALGRVVLINEDIKQVVRSAFAINLMALNAILVARRAGSAAAGFGIVASEMRELSAALEATMATLRVLSDRLLEAVTRSMRHARIERALACTAEQGEASRTLLQPVLARAAEHRAQLEREIAQHCAALLRDIHNAVEVSRLADSLAHMAKIEASWSSDHRIGLGTVSEELAQSLRGILPLLKALSSKLGDFRE